MLDGTHADFSQVVFLTRAQPSVDVHPFTELQASASAYLIICRRQGSSPPTSVLNLGTKFRAPRSILLNDDHVVF